MAPELQAAVEEFTGARGRELTDWTPESVDQRIERIYDRLGPNVAVPLHSARFGIYRHASEISHGTLFGAMFALGMTTPSGPSADASALQQHVNDHLSMVLLLTAMSIGALLGQLAEEYGDLDLSRRASVSLQSATQRVGMIWSGPPTTP